MVLDAFLGVPLASGSVTEVCFSKNSQFYVHHFFTISCLESPLILQGSNLDSNAKMWRLVADLMNDLGMT